MSDIFALLDSSTMSVPISAIPVCVRSLFALVRVQVENDNIGNKGRAAMWNFAKFMKHELQLTRDQKSDAIFILCISRSFCHCHTSESVHAQLEFGSGGCEDSHVDRAERTYDWTDEKICFDFISSTITYSGPTIKRVRAMSRRAFVNRTRMCPYPSKIISILLQVAHIMNVVGYMDSNCLWLLRIFQIVGLN